MKSLEAIFLDKVMKIKNNIIIDGIVDDKIYYLLNRLIYEKFTFFIKVEKELKLIIRGNIDKFKKIAFTYNLDYLRINNEILISIKIEKEKKKEKQQKKFSNDVNEKIDHNISDTNKKDISIFDKIINFFKNLFKKN
jgi:hypothetical protein